MHTHTHARTHTHTHTHTHNTHRELYFVCINVVCINIGEGPAAVRECVGVQDDDDYHGKRDKDQLAT